MIGKKGRGTQNLAASSLSALDSGIPARPDSMDLTIPVTTLDGRQIEITVKNYPTKMTENDLLTGEDGGTMKRYAILMQQLAQQLFDEKVINEDQFGALRNIANAGFDGSKAVSTLQEDFKKRYNPNSKVVNNYDISIVLGVADHRNKIEPNLKLFDKKQNKAGIASNLHDNYEKLIKKESLLEMDSFSSPSSPLGSLILDLSLKIGNGLLLPQEKGTMMINHLCGNLEGTYGDILESLEQREDHRIAEVNLKQNSAQMCGLGKGSVNEPQIKCVPSI
jgi:hypothetical protein